jgi:hypothetical protein
MPVQVTTDSTSCHLTGKTDARPLALEEAKPKIVEALKKAPDTRVNIDQGRRDGATTSRSQKIWSTA